MRLTDISIRQLPAPEKGQRIYFDDTLRSFGCRISQGGTRTFVVQHGFDRQLITIGRYPTVTLAAAREEARRILAERVLRKRRPESIAWNKAKERFLVQCADRIRPSTHGSYARVLDKHFPFGNKRLTDVSAEDIERRLRRIDAPHERNHALVGIKVFLNWALKKNYLEWSPCARMAPSRQPARERVLSETELAALLQTALLQRDFFARIVALLILTGQRRGEVGALRWSWINVIERTITIPPSVAKNRRSHTFPFGAVTAQILESIPRTGELLFPASREHVRGRPTSSFNGWSKCKQDLDAIAGVSDYRLHDLRRTFATGLAALGTPVQVTERLLNHVSGTHAGIVGIYQRHSYLQEMRDAMAAWERHLETLLQSEAHRVSSVDNGRAARGAPATLLRCQQETDIARQSPTVSDIVGQSPT
jgi:integrase